MAETRKERLRDPTQLAKLIGDIATGQVEDKEQDNRDLAAMELGRLGGNKGGRARAEKLSHLNVSEGSRKKPQRADGLAKFKS